MFRRKEGYSLDKEEGSLSFFLLEQATVQVNHWGIGSPLLLCSIITLMSILCYAYLFSPCNLWNILCRLTMAGDFVWTSWLLLLLFWWQVCKYARKIRKKSQLVMIHASGGWKYKRLLSAGVSNLLGSVDRRGILEPLHIFIKYLGGMASHKISTCYMQLFIYTIS